MNLRKMKKKGISPVIASIILIAITVAIAIAVAGWVFGLFGSYTAGTAIKVSGVSYGSTSDILTLIFDNTGGNSDTITKLEIPGVKTLSDLTEVISPNKVGQSITFTLGTGNTLTVGQIYTVKITLASGNIITHVFTA